MVTFMKKTIIFLILAAALLSAAGCSAEKDKTEKKTSLPYSSVASEDVSKEEIKPVSSSLTSPLSAEEWGSAAKFSTADNKYYNVPIRVTAVTTGSDAEKQVKTFMQENETYSYKSPEKGMEWVVIEYEISLDGFPTDKTGTDAAITAFISSGDGSPVRKGSDMAGISTINMTDGKYSFEGKVKGRSAFEMFTGVKDYVVAFGEYGETQAFFSPSSPTG